MDLLDSTNVGSNLDPKIPAKERIIILVVLVTITFLTLLDVYEDLEEGTTITHVSAEFLIIASTVLGSAYMWLKIARSWQKEKAEMVSEILVKSQDLIKWRQKASVFTQGLASAIDEQLSDWGLSSAERDIAVLIIKGLSIKEIAEGRKTSESTVRQQAATIYKKSGLEGRAQLSAFFLEDLFIPTK